MGVLRQDTHKSLEFILTQQKFTLDKFSARLSKLEIKNGSKTIKN